MNSSETRLRAAARIREEKDEIVARWMAQVRTQLPNAAAESTRTLLDSLPQLIDSVAMALERGSLSQVQDEIDDKSTEHGQQRARETGYDLTLVISEYQILKRILIHRLSKSDCLTPEVRNLVEDAIDSFIRRSASEYAQELVRENTRIQSQLRYRLQTEWEMLSAVIDKMPVGVVIAEARTGRILLHNREAVRLLGHPIDPAEDFHGYARFGAFHSDGRPYAAEDYPMARAAVRGETVHEEIQMYRRGDGRITHLAASAAPVRDPGGQPKYAVAVFRDVDIKVRNAARLEETLRELREERDLRDRFIAALSHDLRNPLSAAGMNLQLLRKHAGNAEMVDRLSGKGLESLARADRMLNDLLDAGRLRAGQTLPIQPASCDLGKLVRSVAEDLALLHGDRFVVDAPAVLQGHWDCHALRRVLENLCTNAVKYGTAGTRIGLKLEQRDGAVQLSVHNAGPAIPEREREAIFQPFRRSATAHEPGTLGWGIGLAVVRALSEAHGGMVTVKSESHAGTTFTVTLPMSAGQKVA